MGAGVGAVVTAALAASPALALLAPRAQPGWRVGYAWTLAREAHGLDWGVSVRIPLQTSELGLVSLSSSIQATWPGSHVGDWEFRAGGLIQPYRQQAPYGLFYSLRYFSAVPFKALTGIGVRFGPLSAGYYPGTWNGDSGLNPGSTVAVIEPGWFSGLYVQLRWMYLPGGASVQLAFGLEEGW